MNFSSFRKFVNSIIRNFSEKYSKKAILNKIVTIIFLSMGVFATNITFLLAHDSPHERILANPLRMDTNRSPS